MLTSSMPVIAFLPIGEHWRADERALLDTKLADRTSLQRGVPDRASTLDPTTPDVSTGRADTSHDHSPASSGLLARLRHDLVEAQRSKGALQLDLKMITDDIQKLRTASKTEGKRVTQLTSERALLTTKLSDRDEELRGKAKLLEVCQSEELSSKDGS